MAPDTIVGHRLREPHAVHEPQAAFAALKAAACSSDPVAGYTHNFYRYPARFSPQFARAAIEVFSRPGDAVLDPFMGGGTSAAEALVAGRRFLGCDINSLAVFVTRPKTAPLSKADIRAVGGWASALESHVGQPPAGDRDAARIDCQRKLPPHNKRAFQAALDTLTNLVQFGRDGARVAHCFGPASGRSTAVR